MKYQIKIKQSFTGFYLEFIEDYDYECSTDKSICSILDIDLNVYQKSLKENYNAFAIKRNSTRKEMYFSTEQDAKKALEWVESILIANMLKEVI